MTPSTLGGGTDEQVDRFRQLRLMEYYEICKLCKERNISLSENLLQKGNKHKVKFEVKYMRVCH